MTPVQIAAYIKRQKTPTYSQMSRKNLLSAVNWFMATGGLIFATSRGRIVGVACMRTVMNRQEAEENWLWNPWGTRLCIDLAVTSHPRGLEAIVREIAWRFPSGSVFWRRCNRGSDRLREYNFGRAVHLVTRTNSHE
jgi:hypothetical protein